MKKAFETLKKVFSSAPIVISDHYGEGLSKGDIDNYFKRQRNQ